VALAKELVDPSVMIRLSTLALQVDNSFKEEPHQQLNSFAVLLGLIHVVPVIIVAVGIVTIPLYRYFI
jgi:hypothetical protein